MFSRLLTVVPLLLSAACGAGDSSTRLEIIEDPTLMAKVDYTSLEPIRAWVEFGPVGGTRTSTPLSTFDTSHRFTLVGLRGDADYVYRVVVQTTGGSLALPEHTFHTPPLADEVTPMLLDGGAAEGVGRVVFPLYHPSNDVSLVYVVDADGYIVWWRHFDGMVLSARPSRLAAGVWVQVTRVTSDATYDASALEFVPFDGSEITSISTPLAHHDFHEQDDGSLMSIIAVTRKIGADWVTGDELQIFQPDGEMSVFWSAFGNIPVEENAGWSSEPADWTHANGLYWDPDTETWALSLFRQQEVVLIDAAGTTQSRIGLEQDWDFGDDPGFGPQHGPRLTAGGLQVFDNAGAGVSRLVEYAIDTERRVATRRWEQSSPDGQQILVIGDGFRLDSGTTVSSWGESGDVLTMSSTGQVLRRLDTEGDGTVGRIFPMGSFYEP